MSPILAFLAVIGGAILVYLIVLAIYVIVMIGEVESDFDDREE